MGPKVIDMSIASSAAADSVAPSQSNLPLVEPGPVSPVRALSRMANETITARIPRGMLNTNTACQPNVPTSNPPSAGPATAPMPMIVIIMPRALPRSLSGKVDISMAIPVPWFMAAPPPG